MAPVSRHLTPTLSTTLTNPTFSEENSTTPPVTNADQPPASTAPQAPGTTSGTTPPVSATPQAPAPDSSSDDVGSTPASSPVDFSSSTFEPESPSSAPVDLSGGCSPGRIELSIGVTFRVSFGGGLVPRGCGNETPATAPTSTSSSSASPGSSSAADSRSTSLPSVDSSSDSSSSSPTTRREVFLFGNKKRSRTLGEYLKRAKKRGLPVDLSKFSPEALKTKVPSGHAIAVTADGQVLGMKKTSELMANPELGVAGHLQKKGQGDNEHTVSRQGSETIGRGGTIELNGEQLDVKNTLLRSPVALDLNRDGRIGTTGVSTAQSRRDNKVGRTVDFDVDGDGRKEKTEWMAGDGDALLVDDRDGGASKAVGTTKGLDGRRLFGDQGGRFGNGYEKLAQLDRNQDGTLEGDELDGVKAWIDDGDAKLEAGELKTLKELGVTQVSTGMHRELNGRGESLMRSSFVRNGERQMTEDVWFASRA